ncbi:MAG: hypothetical protein ACD_3C00194G0002 [uncultured bacterium (gcode 4)]|uniref:Uncharacterized protein n=1 Tax=uncultured bacterium (gcode 4) TaxID=1234023 RepID=K2G060_9BACT|nr:MAG: hypothetical protein ACD_3C00194G0002 [uncultured bacterium (gcode 4)]
MKLNEKIDSIVESKKIKWIDLRVLRTKEQYDSVMENKIWIDPRLKSEENDCNTSVFSWLEFNKGKASSQAIVIYDAEKPVWVISFIITPWEIFNRNNRYLKRDWNSIQVLDFEGAIWEKIPEFIISPAWSKIKDEYRWKFTIQLFRLYESVIKEILGNVPPNAWIEVIAQWKYWSKNMQKWQDYVFSLPIWSYIPKEMIDFDFAIFWEPQKQSESTSKLARYLGIDKRSDICNYKTLGPIFYKRIS